MTHQLDAQLQSKLARLHRHYLALSPSSAALLPASAFPTQQQLAQAATQDYLARNLIVESNGGLKGSIPAEGGQSWKRMFWRRVVKQIEGGYDLRRAAGEDLTDEEVNADILEALVDLLPFDASGVPPPATRTYAWGKLLSPPEQWDHVTTKEDGRMIVAGTTGLRTWQASVSLANHLITKPELLRLRRAGGKRVPVLELGAGAGLLSLVVAKLVGKEDAVEEPGLSVIASDVDDGVLANLTANVQLNKLDDSIRAKALDWAWSLEADGATRLAEWEREVFGEGQRAQLILGADILYDPDLSPILAGTLAFLLRPREDDSPQPTAILAGTIRQESTWHTFLSAFEKSGLHVEHVALETAAEDGIVGAEGWEGEGEVKLIRLTATAH